MTGRVETIRRACEADEPRPLPNNLDCRSLDPRNPVGRHLDRHLGGWRDRIRRGCPQHERRRRESAKSVSAHEQSQTCLEASARHAS